MTWTQSIYYFGRHKREVIAGRSDEFVDAHRQAFRKSPNLWTILVDEPDLLIVVYLFGEEGAQTWVYRKEDST